MMAGYSVTSINMKISRDIDDSLRYFAGGPRHSWTGKVLKLQPFLALLVRPTKLDMGRVHQWVEFGHCIILILWVWSVSICNFV